MKLFFTVGNLLPVVPLRLCSGSVPRFFAFPHVTRLSPFTNNRNELILTLFTILFGSVYPNVIFRRRDKAVIVNIF